VGTFSRKKWTGVGLLNIPGMWLRGQLRDDRDAGIAYRAAVPAAYVKGSFRSERLFTCRLNGYIRRISKNTPWITYFLFVFLKTAARGISFEDRPENDPSYPPNFTGLPEGRYFAG